eukprot:m.879668 g.879668  ORF g.879668 m.879668 type:complete len:169 (-) comp59843_c0_seq38:89-595(-)
MPLWSIGSLDFYFFPPFFLPFLHSFFPCSLLMAEARRETREDEEVQDAAFERDVDLLENVLSGNVQRCTALLQQGADVHFRGMEGREPALHLAVWNSNAALAGVLLEHGANMWLLDDANISAVQIACEEGELEILELMLQHGLEVNDRDERVCGLLFILSLLRELMNV